MKSKHRATIGIIVMALWWVIGYLWWMSRERTPDTHPYLSDSVHHDYPPIEEVLHADYPLADQSIIDELQEQNPSALIGVEGVLGGTIGFYDRSQIWNMGDGQYLAYREDGHIMGYALLYKNDNHRSLLHRYTY